MENSNGKGKEIWDWYRGKREFPLTSERFRTIFVATRVNCHFVLKSIRAWHRRSRLKLDRWMVERENSKWQTGKPSSLFCCNKRPGGRQGGSGKKRWPQEQGNSNTVLGKWKNCTSLESPATNHSFYISFENPKHIAVRKGTTTITEIQMISQRSSN